MGNKSGHPEEVWDIAPFSQKWPKLLYFYVQTRSINILPLTQVYHFPSTSVAEVSVLGRRRDEADTSS